MLFNSYLYIYVFLPVSVSVYFLLFRRFGRSAALWWLFSCSLVYYGWWDPRYALLFCLSMAVNYTVGILLQRERWNGRARIRRTFLIIGIVVNVGLLAYFKYTDFFIGNLNLFLPQPLQPLRISLPLGISFYSFIQIAYLVDTYRGGAGRKGLVDYLSFASFFPQIFSGPIVRYGDVSRQRGDARTTLLNYDNIAKGLFLFSLGLFKKIMIADNLAPFADTGFALSSQLTLADSWLTSISYTLQLYFDFSGYTDMAIGTALMFNIRLPINFNSPYKARNLQDFWRRWHITLSSFLRDYIYIPLGGSRAGEFRTYSNIIITFLVAGIWHGAGWTFVFWGFLHGLGLVIHRFWNKTSLHMPRPLALFITFNYVNVLWVFFRARSFSDAVNVLSAMAGLKGIVLPRTVGILLGNPAEGYLRFAHEWMLRGDLTTMIMIGMLVAATLILKNSNEIIEGFKPSVRYAALAAAAFCVSLVFIQRYTEFIYFGF
ncbi:MAG: MBOAT family protein [Spirochaetes bacterium]|nr:MBOAT family protein [Spirochaetota bacterium]